MFFSLVITSALLALILALFLARYVLYQDAGSKEMEKISQAIQAGAKSFLCRQYVIAAIFMIFIALILLYFNWRLSLSFILGAFFSALAGCFGMTISTKANSRTAQSLKKSLGIGFRTAFFSGAVMSLSVVGLGLLGVSLLYYFFQDPVLIYGFGFGASFIALFARVGGGIFTKAADIGADIVGKVEKSWPEDDSRNPAVIADSVGDNVGDVAGMGADLLESYVGSIIAAMVLGTVITDGVILPLILAALGVLCSIVGFLFVRAKKKENIAFALNRSVLISAFLMVIFSALIFQWLKINFMVYTAMLSGLIAGIVISLSTYYYTSSKRNPTKKIALASQTSPATNVISGLALGFQSTIVPVLAVVMSLVLSYYLANLYGIAIAAVGLLSTLGITLAADCYGPVADNAASLAQMSRQPKKVRKRADALDSVGNTTATIGKGFAIGSAALTAFALFATYIKISGLEFINILHIDGIVGLFLGSLTAFCFAALIMNSVSRAAQKVILEARRQLVGKQGKKIIQGIKKPDYQECIKICTNSALKEMIAPILLALFVPILIGLALGKETVGGLLVGVTIAGFLLAMFMANAGGAWDNAKKFIEEGNFGGKGSQAHKSAVIGDTVGDVMKDAAGPALNILIKLISITAIVMLPLIL